MLKKLRVRLTILSTLITGIILAGMAVGALIIALEQQRKSNFIAFQSDFNSIVYHIQSQTVLDRSWMAQTESGNRLIIHIEDKGIPLLFDGSWTPLTSRSVLIEQAKQQAAYHGFVLESPPSSSLNPDYIFYEITGMDGERYSGASAWIPAPLGWVSLTLLKDMRLEDSQARLQKELYFAMVLAGMFLLALFSWWFTGHAIRPIEQSQKQQAEFIAAASHELRTPLAVIGTSASAVSMSEPEQSMRFIRNIRKECSRMSRLVDDLLTLARADAKNWSIRFEPTDIDTLLLSQYELFEEAARQKNLSLEIHLDADTPLPMIYGDEQRLGQVLSILLDNAISYTPEGGRVCLSAYSENSSINISVADNGPGISDEDKLHLFERFYRADSSRTGNHYGLGLSIAKEIVELHRGKISVHDSKKTSGTVFSIELPIEQRKTSALRHKKRAPSDKSG